MGTSSFRLASRLPAWLVLALAACSGESVVDGPDAGRPVGDVAFDATRPDGTARCERDADCADGVFCNGVERCLPMDSSANARGCVAASAPACMAGQTCDEPRATCLSDCDLRGDADRDGHRAANCGGDDCDDADPLRYPGRTELCDGADHDDDCDLTTYGARDLDHDGFDDNRCCNLTTTGTRHCGDDCNDLRRNVNPLASEVCDGFDNNCNGITDEGVTVSGFADDDRDLYGDSARVVMACGVSPGFAVLGDDCDDHDSSRHPAAVEICDGLDNDCNGAIDDNARATTWYFDGDRDGFGSASAGTTVSCTPVPGYALLSGDCNDANPAINPAAAEACNGRDDNCNGIADFQVAPGDYEDDDADGAADPRCGAAGTDCDDRDPRSRPGAPEICDGRDNDCNGRVDEGTATIPWYVDRDNDGYGSTATAAVMSCEPPVGRVSVAGDCDDNDPARHPGVVDLCDALDNDCDGTVDEDAPTAAYYRDRDVDGYGGGTPVLRCSLPAGYVANAGDCDDASAARHPGVTEVCNGVDDDCNSMVDDGPSAVASCPARGNATVACAAGACGFNCSTGFANCDGNPVNGCEADTTLNPAHCGSCATVCSGGASCVASACVCAPGQASCGGSCTDVRVDAANCGACGRACPSGTTCGGGTCLCASGLTSCGGRCTDPRTDAANCGACGTVCPSGTLCLSGACTCPSGQTLCGGRCTSLLSDLTNCGRCGGTCLSGQTCSAGSCVTIAAGETCATATPLLFNGTTATVADDTSAATHDLAPSSCEGAGAGDVFYAFTLAAPKTVYALVRGTSGSWQPTVSIRAAGCAGIDLACGNADATSNSVLQPLAAGSYVVIVGGRGTFDRGAFALTVIATDPLANDACTAPTTLTFTSGAATVSGDTSTALHDAGIATCEAPTASDLFYRFTLTAPRSVTASVTATGTAWQPTLSLRSTCAGADLACANTAASVNALASRLLSAGTYVVIVGGRAATDRGAFNLTVTTTDPGAGDFCGTARPLTFFGPTATVSDDTSGATHDGLISTCEDPAANDLFYSFTVTGTQNVFATVTATGWQPTVSLRAAGCGSVDLLCANTASATNRLDTTLPAGTYVVVVGGRTASDRGAFSLTVSVATVTGETCATVVDYTGTPASPMAGDTTYARSEGNAYCGDASAGDVFYRVVLTSPQILTATVTAAGWQPTVSLGAACTSASACGTGVGGTGSATAALSAGTIYVRVGGASRSDRGRFSLDISVSAPPPGEMCENAIDIPAGASLSTYAGDTSRNFPGVQTPACNTGNDVVYRLALTVPTRVTARLLPTGWSASLVLGIGSSCPGLSTTATCWNDGAIQTPIDLDPGTYYLTIKGRTTGSFGPYRFEVEQLTGAFPSYVAMPSPSDVSWIDACAQPGHLSALSAVDDGSIELPISIPFTYWGTAMSPTNIISVNSNGWIGMDGAPSTASAFSIPNTQRPNGVISVFNANLLMRSGICIASVGSSPTRRLVIEWLDANTPRDDCPLDRFSDYSFESILSEGSNTIDFVYSALSRQNCIRTIVLTNRCSSCSVVSESPNGFNGVEDFYGLRAVRSPAGNAVRFSPTP